MLVLICVFISMAVIHVLFLWLSSRFDHPDQGGLSTRALPSGARSHGGQEEEEAALFVYQNLLVHVLILIVYMHRTLLIARLLHREAAQHGTSERGLAFVSRAQDFGALA